MIAAVGLAGLTLPAGQGQAAVTPPLVPSLYVTINNNDVVPITLATQRVRPAITAPGAFEIAIAPDGETAYTAGFLGVVPIDLATGAVAPAIPLPGTPFDIVFAPDGSTAYAAVGANGLIPIDVATGTPGAPILMPNAFNAAITPDGATAYVTDNAGSVYPVTLATERWGQPSRSARILNPSRSRRTERAPTWATSAVTRSR